MSQIPDPMDDGPRILDRNNPFGETPAAAQARRRRSMALAFGLIAFVVIIFIVTMVKLKGNVLAANHL